MKIEPAVFMKPAVGHGDESLTLTARGNQGTRELPPMGQVIFVGIIFGGRTGQPDEREAFVNISP